MALFSKNWKQWIVSRGEPFQIEYLDRAFKGRSRVVFKVDDETGKVIVNGTELIGNQNIVGNVVATGDVQSATAHITTLTVATAAHLPASTVKTASIAGADASGGTVSTVLAGAVVGQKVVSAIVLTGSAAGTDVSADFESTISIAGHIQQTGVNLSVTATHILIQLLN